MPKSISAPTVLTFSDNVRPFDRLTVTSSSTSLSGQFRPLHNDDILHSRWAHTNPNGVDIFTDHLNSLLQYFPQSLLLHDRFFGTEVTCTMDRSRMERLLKLASYLSAGNLLRDSFDTYLTCFTNTVFYFPTALSTNEDDFPYADEQFATWLLRRIRDITNDFHILGLLVTSAIGCVRSSCTLDDASCAGRLLRILMSVLSEGTDRFSALLKLLHHYHRDLEQFWSPIGFSWTSSFVCQLTQEDVAEDVFSTLVPIVKDRELVFLSSKEQIEFAFPTDNFWVGSKFFDVAHDKIARQFIGNAFIRSKAFELLSWCQKTISSKQRLLEERLAEIQEMKFDYAEFQDMASQLLFWCFAHEQTSGNRSSSLDDSTYGSSSLSRFGINIPEAFAVITITLTKRSQWPKTFKDLAAGTLQPSTFFTWLMTRLQLLMTDDGSLEFIYSYFRRMLRYQSGGVGGLLPSAASSGRRYAHAMSEHVFGRVEDSTSHMNAQDSSADEDAELESSEVAMLDIYDVENAPMTQGPNVLEAAKYQTATSSLQASLTAMVNPGIASSSSSMSGEQREFRSLAQKLQQKTWPFGRILNSSEAERSADQVSVSSHESWRFDQVSGMV